MKKLFLLLISCIFAFSCVFALGCSCSDEYTEPCKDGEHVYGAWVYQNDATCLKDGTEIRSCENPYCMSKESRTVSGTRILEHNIVFVAEKQAYCLEEGVKAHYECSICKTAFTDQQGQNIISDLSTLSIPKTKHEYEDYFTDDILPDKYTSGERSKHCIHYEKCGSRIEVEEIPSWTDAPEGWTPPA